MSSNKVYVGVGDNKTTITFTIKDSADAVLNITGFTIRFKIRKQDGVANTNDGNNTCTLTNASLGIFTYAFAATDLPSAGVYQGQIHITFGDGKTHIVPTFLQIVAIESF